MPILAALLMIFGQVDLPLAPQSQFAATGSIVTVDLGAHATTTESVAAIDAILSWNPAELQFMGAVPGDYAWFVAGFLPDPDGINLSTTDGSALYTALAPVATPLILPPDIVVAGFQFKILSGGAGGVNVGLLRSMGTFGKTRVISSTPGVEVTGDISGTACVGVPGTWTDMGGGISGVAGVPLLTGTGPMACEALTTYTLINAKPNQLAYFPVGISNLGLPLKGGVLVPSLDLILFFVTSPTGDISFGANWPLGLPSGFTIYYQYWLKDNTAIKGWAASNGLRSVTG